MMEYSPAGFDVNVVNPPGQGDPQRFMVDMGSLYDFLSRLEDRWDARGLRYKLVHILVFVVLAKLAGEDRLTGISEWVRHRKEALAKALGLRRSQAPHRTTYSRILGERMDAEEFEEAVGGFFASVPVASVPVDGQLVQVTIDGKALRGSIAGGQTQGVHLMAAYLPPIFPGRGLTGVGIWCFPLRDDRFLQVRRRARMWFRKQQYPCQPVCLAPKRC